MRLRQALALTGVGALVLVGPVAAADQSSRSAPSGLHRPALPATVTLPTGDQVLLRPDGSMTFQPATGREKVGYMSPSALDGSGDLVVIPDDVAWKVNEGSLDPRLFNVSALLRSGHPDARKVSPAMVDKREYQGFSPRAEPTNVSASSTTVRVTVKGHDGEAPETAAVTYVNLDTGELGSFSVNQTGVAQGQLPPGRYNILTSMFTSASGAAPGEAVSGVNRIAVGNRPIMFTVDGTTARPVTATVDRADAELIAAEFRVEAESADGATGVLTIYGLNRGDKAYAIPTEGIDDGTVLLGYRPTFTNPGGPAAADPYTYNLVFLERDGLPADPSFTARDSELAVRTVEYQGLGGEPVDGYANSYGQPVSGGSWFGVPSVPIVVPSTRTEYYTAGPDIEWRHYRRLVGSAGMGDDVIQTPPLPMEPGTHEESWTWNHAPLSVSLGDHRFPMYGMGIIRYSDGLYGNVALFSSAATNEYIYSYGVTGTAVLRKDGTEIGRGTNLPSLGFPLPEGDAGRYTLSVEATRDVPWTPLGTRSNVEWGFASAPPVGDPRLSTPLNIGVVRFAAEGVVNGFAPATQDQAVTLTYVNQPGTADRTATTLTFEVSYDDGTTWQAVAIERNGDVATAVLHHPEGARFVSVRMSAADDAGNTVTHSTIRSYGLR